MNIVLIGNMGAGKTSAGRVLARRLGRVFIDMDEYIELKEGKSVGQLFEPGEENFRRAEARAAEDISRLESCVVATGGGVVKNAANMQKLSRSGIIVYIKRPPELVLASADMRGRPLLRDKPERLYEIMAERAPLYEKYADFIIKSTGTIEEAAEKIYQKIQELKI
ncbi:MAG: shikimate kinase [Oscillospiraceae bacterium]|nr:shikimate kinase [Oscillospiraceae bacterium]